MQKQNQELIKLNALKHDKYHLEMDKNLKAMTKKMSKDIIDLKGYIGDTKQLKT
jgi:hypothetical protein